MEGERKKSDGLAGMGWRERRDSKGERRKKEWEQKNGGGRKGRQKRGLPQSMAMVMCALGTSNAKATLHYHMLPIPSSLFELSVLNEPLKMTQKT